MGAERTPPHRDPHPLAGQPVRANLLAVDWFERVENIEPGLSWRGMPGEHVAAYRLRVLHAARGPGGLDLRGSDDVVECSCAGQRHLLHQRELVLCATYAHGIAAVVGWLRGPEAEAVRAQAIADGVAPEDALAHAAQRRFAHA